MTINELRQIGKRIKEAMTCHHCGGSIMIAVTSHKGHGIGLHGSAYYGGTDFESITPEKHCACPDGPMWNSLVNSELGQGFKLAEARQRYPNLPLGQVAIWNPDNEQWCSIPARLWRRAVIQAYQQEVKEDKE